MPMEREQERCARREQDDDKVDREVLHLELERLSYMMALAMNYAERVSVRCNRDHWPSLAEQVPYGFNVFVAQTDEAETLRFAFFEVHHLIQELERRYRPAGLLAEIQGHNPVS